DFHAEVRNMGPRLLIESGKGDVTFPIATPGDMLRLRFGCCYRARDARDGIEFQVSLDAGKTWKTVDRAPGGADSCKYVTFGDVPRGTREALVRYAATSRNATGLFSFRIDADYQEASAGFRPVKITYRWEEGGQAKEDVHVAKSPEETYT